MNNFKKILNLRLKIVERKNNDFIINYMKMLERKNNIKTVNYITNLMTCFATGAFMTSIFIYTIKH